MRFTLGTITSGRAPAVLGLCSTDTRIVQWANAAQERLMNCGRWYGTVVRAKFCVSDGCLVWPREVATVEGVRLCGKPIANSNMWYEFTEYIDPYCDMCCWKTDPRLVALSNTPVVAEIEAGKAVVAYATNAADVGKDIIVQGRDSGNAWVRTDDPDDPGTPLDGERITLALTPGTVGTTLWAANGITGIQKEDTDYPVLLYQYDTTTTATEQLLGRYQPNEEYPEYRKSSLRNIGNGCCCSTDDDGDAVYTVEAIVSLQHVPVSAANDWFILQNQHALELGMQALLFEEDGKDAEAEIKWKKAIRELKRQNEKYWPTSQMKVIATGHGTAQPLRTFNGFI